MDRYNYYEAVAEDAKAAALEWLEWNDKNGSEALAYYEEIFEALWIDDSVTGNASGSYFFNTWKAEEALCHNTELLMEALQEFGGDYSDVFERGAEYADLTIRCYVLGEVLGEVLGAIESGCN